MTDRICGAPDCERRRDVAGYCWKHYYRLRRTGTLDAKPWHRRGTCSVDECNEPDAQGGMCSKHHARARRHGDTSVVLGGRFEERESHPNWVGDLVRYRAAHTRIQRAKGSASDHRCVDCGGPAEQWSYNHRDLDELLDGDLRYSPDPAFYDPRCVGCHGKFDSEHRAAASKPT